MQTEVVLCGHDLALHLPDQIVTQIELREGQRVEIASEDGRFVLILAPSRYVLADLLKGTTPETMREAFEWGPDKGRETAS